MNVPARPKRPLDRKSIFSSILGEARDEASASDVMTLPVTALSPMTGQPRRQFDERKLDELASSIMARGVLQPLIVRRKTADGRYEIVAGERRWRAAHRAGLTEVPVIVRPLDDHEAFEVAIIENLQRTDLDPIDRADATARLIAVELGIDVAQVPARLSKVRAELRRAKETTEYRQALEDAERLDAMFRVIGGSWQTYLVHHLPILRFPHDVLTAMREGLEHAKGRVIARVADEEVRGHLIGLAVRGATVEELRAEIDRPTGKALVPGHVARVRSALANWQRIEELPARRRRAVEELLDRLDRLLNE